MPESQKEGTCARGTGVAIIIEKTPQGARTPHCACCQHIQPDIPVTKFPIEAQMK